MNITIYTDGSANNKTGHGGWGAVVYTDGDMFEFNGAVIDTTSNRMELLAVIRVLSLFNEDSDPITLYSDSKYVVDGCNQYVQRWSINNWQDAIERDIKNLSYWKRLKKLLDKLNVDIKWVKGHSGDPGNDRADWLAGQAMNDGRKVNQL